MTHYISRAVIDREAPEHALRPLLDPPGTSKIFDAHRRLVWTLFPGDGQKRDFIWRSDGNGKFLIVSARAPLASRIFRPLETKAYAPRLQRGDRLSFLLRANATMARSRRRERAATNQTKKMTSRDRRVDIVMNAMIEQERLGDQVGDRASRRMRVANDVAREWLTKQGERAGFTLQNSIVEDYSVASLSRRGQRRAKIGVLDLKGSIIVVEPSDVKTALFSGIGRAKAFGCGLMLVRRL